MRSDKVAEEGVAEIIPDQDSAKWNPQVPERREQRVFQDRECGWTRVMQNDDDRSVTFRF
jgi:hypothetical protein